MIAGSRWTGPAPRSVWWQRGGRPLTRHRDGLALVGAVGPDAANRRHDVARIEALLGGAGALDVTATEGPTGYFGRRTDAAIRKLQRDRRLKVDGLITPQGPTLKALMASLPRAPVPAFAVPKTQAAVGRDARAANGRLVDAAMKTRGAGIVPKLLADAAAQGASGEAEVADFFAQLAERDTTRARDLATLVAAERARPDLPEEGGKGEGRGPQQVDSGREPRDVPDDRPKRDHCLDEKLDAEAADRAHTAANAELAQVDADLHNIGIELANLYARRDEVAELLEDMQPGGTIRAVLKGKARKALRRIVAPALVVAHGVRYLADPYNPFTLDSRIAELEARQAELQARRAELGPEVDHLWARKEAASITLRKCLAKHKPDSTDPDQPPAGPGQGPIA